MRRLSLWSLYHFDLETFFTVLDWISTWFYLMLDHIYVVSFIYWRTLSLSSQFYNWHYFPVSTWVLVWVEPSHLPIRDLWSFSFCNLLSFSFRFGDFSLSYVLLRIENPQLFENPQQKRRKKMGLEPGPSECRASAEPLDHDAPFRIATYL